MLFELGVLRDHESGSMDSAARAREPNWLLWRRDGARTEEWATYEKKAIRELEASAATMFIDVRDLIGGQANTLLRQGRTVAETTEK